MTTPPWPPSVPPADDRTSFAPSPDLDMSIYGVAPACRVSNVRQPSIDWTNDAERRLDDIEQMAADVEETIQWLLDQVEKLPSPVLMPVKIIVGDYFDVFVDGFRARIDIEIETIRQLWQALRPTLEEAARCAGNPVALSTMADTWESYAAQFESLADSVTLETLATDDSWYGSGATAYATKAQSQQIAIGGLADDAKTVQFALQDHAAAIVAFDTLMADATSGFDTSMKIATGGAVATLAGLPLGGWPAVIAFVLGVIATAASIVYAFISYFSAVNTANSLFDEAAMSHQTRLTHTTVHGSAAWPVFAN